MKMLDQQKTLKKYPSIMVGMDHKYPQYMKPEATHIAVEIRDRDMVETILTAYDHGLDCLNEEGIQQIQMFLARAVDGIKEGGVTNPR